MIIDAHAHVHPDSEALGPKQDASVSTFLKKLDASPLDKIVLLPIEPFIPNAFVQEVAAQRPDKIVCFGSANPKDGKQGVEAFEALAQSGTIKGLKFHPRRQGFGLSEISDAIALAQCAARHDLPILVDSFPYGKGALRDESLEIIEALAEGAPTANIIIAHLGGIRILDALILARTSYNIYLDLSLTHEVYKGSHIEQDIFYAIRRIGADRCLYGSDYPDTDLSGYYHGMRAALEANKFTSTEQDNIFGGTAAKIIDF